MPTHTNDFVLRMTESSPREVEGVYYFLCSESKNANQLGGYHAAELHLCFRLCQKHFF